MTKLDLKAMIRGKVRFDFYRDGNLYYRTENNVLFPVPVTDAGTATFLAEDKAILFMRYMRKFIASVQQRSGSDKVSAIMVSAAATTAPVEQTNESQYVVIDGERRRVTPCPDGKPDCEVLHTEPVADEGAR